MFDEQKFQYGKFNPNHLILGVSHDLLTLASVTTISI